MGSNLGVQSSIGLQNSPDPRQRHFLTEKFLTPPLPPPPDPCEEISSIMCIVGNVPHRVVNLQIIPKSVYQLCVQILHHFWICPFVTTHCWSNGLNGNTNITSERDYVKNKGQYINLKSMINSSDLSAESLAILFT